MGGGEGTAERGGRETTEPFRALRYHLKKPPKLLSWMFKHDCLDTCCFGCLICMCSVFLYLHLFSAVEHVSHGKAL